MREEMEKLTPKQREELMKERRDSMRAEMKKFFYDTAGAANPGAIASLIQLVSSSNILFGTDFPPGGTSAAMRSMRWLV